MIQIFFRSKRLLWIALTIALSSIFIFLLSAVYQPRSTAEAEIISPPPTPIPYESELTNPFVCAIPDDGTFLPCHANLMADEIPIQRLSDAIVRNEPCVDGMVADYPCHAIDLLSYMPLSHFGNVRTSDIWGWTDPSTGKEVVILTLRDHTAFVDVSDPFDPKVVGTLPMTEGSFKSAWRDVKTYQNTAYIVADIAGPFGMQIFDLTRLRGITQTTIFTADNIYTGISSTHNIVINEESGLAALVGISSGEERCSGGMHLLDLTVDRLSPAFAGCVDSDGYVHDSQCVIYHGSDTTYTGREICFNFNEDSVTIVDVTDRSNPVQLSRNTYSQTAYTHQGWLTADHDVLLVDDEGDEQNFDINTTTHIWDLSSLANPKLIGTYIASTEAIDHNQYTHLGYSFQSNYRAGLRVLDVAKSYQGQLEEVAYFDIFPQDDDAKFNATWSSYPYFESGMIAISGVEQGLFLVRPTNLMTQRAAIQMPSMVTVTPGTTVNYDAVVRTLGLTESYRLKDLSAGGAGWTVTTTHAATFTGVATLPEQIDISVSAPFSGDGEAEINLVLESVERPGYIVTGTTQFRIETGELFDITDPDQIQAEGNVVMKPILINNRSGLPERYSIEALGTNWSTQPSVAQTALVGDNDSFEFTLLMTAEEGIQSSYSLTITPESQAGGVQVFNGMVAIHTGAELGVESSYSLAQVTHTIVLTNSGDLPDDFELIVTGGSWPFSVPMTSTGLITHQEAVEMQLAITFGGGFESTNTIRVVSGRSGQEVAVEEIVSRVYRLYLPFVVGSNQLH